MNSIRKSINIILIVGIFTQTLLTAKAETITDYSIISPTVRILAYDGGYNGQIFPYSGGSGTLISKNGLILTNNHVIQDDQEQLLKAFLVCFSLKNDQEPVCEYTAHIVARSIKQDLALLRIDQKDIRGNPLPDLPFLNYQNEAQPKAGDKIIITGYPDIGGSTITATEGTISGFSDSKDYGDVSLFKSSTAVSSGNSGGTVQDASGNFIGMPTAVNVSDTTAEQLGYSIDLRSVRPWINEHLQDQILEIPNNNTLLASKKILFNDANSTHILNYPHYPKFTLETALDWHFLQIEPTSIYLSSTSPGKNYFVSIAIERFPFVITLAEKGYLVNIFEKLEKDKQKLTNYKREPTLFAGVSAMLITFNTYNKKQFSYFIPYGGALIQIQYGIDLNRQQDDLEVYHQLFRNFHFTEYASNPQTQKTFQHDDPPFKIKTFGKFLVKPNETFSSKTAIVDFIKKDSIQGEISLTYDQFPEADKELDIEKLLQNDLEDLKTLSSRFVLMYQDPRLQISGLPGYSLSYTYQGADYSETHKATSIVLRNGDYYFRIEYDDLEDDYNKHLISFKQILDSFQYGDPDNSVADNTIGPLNFPFSDIENHRYSSAITDLYGRNILVGMEDHTFKPENPLTRVEALKIILESKLYHREPDLDKRYQISEYQADSYHNYDFADSAPDSWYQSYVRYARAQNLISGYADGNFAPHQAISLPEALSILFKTYKIKVWQPNVPIPWQKPYIDKALELGIVNLDMLVADHQLNRAEFAFIVSKLLESQEGI